MVLTMNFSGRQKLEEAVTFISKHQTDKLAIKRDYKAAGSYMLQNFVFSFGTTCMEKI